jgi:predicted LPLAT superfamily acyltransferase
MTTWMTTREIGTRWGIRIVFWLALLVGRRPPRALLYVIALYYLAKNRAARAASRAYLERIGEPAGLGGVYRHMLRFAQCTLDRLFLLRGDLGPFVFERHGNEHLAALRRSGRGAVLVGAHLGSFEALRAAASDEDLKVNVLGYFGNARVINDFFDRVGDNSGPRLIDVSGSPVEVSLTVKRRIEAGEVVALLADRTGHGASARVPFLGSDASFPTGGFALAAVLGCPVYLTFGLHYPPNRYVLYCEPFAERLDLPRATRRQALEDCARRYAARLEHYCRLAPDNWFNFYDFWAPEDAPTPGGR